MPTGPSTTSVARWRWLKLKEQGHDLLLISPPGPYGEKLRVLGLRWEPVPMDRRSLNPLREAKLLGWLVALIHAGTPTRFHPSSAGHPVPPGSPLRHQDAGLQTLMGFHAAV